MKARTSWSLWIVLAVVGCLLPAVWAQGSSSGPPTPAQELEMNIGVLNKLRSDPQAKPFILARRKEVLTRRGFADADARLAEIGKIFDEAIALSAADFEKNQQQAVHSQALLPFPWMGTMGLGPLLRVPR